jgi:crotonobetainyl-CoA:carnitine CoA-transferase CaiB-like acyl-CoA transferase
LLLIDALERAFRGQPAAHWRNVIEKRGLSADVIEEYSYPTNDQQVLDNNFIVEQDRARSLGFPLYMSDTPGALRSPAPKTGQHTDSILRELGVAP